MPHLSDSVVAVAVEHKASVILLPLRGHPGNHDGQSPHACQISRPGI